MKTLKLFTVTAVVATGLGLVAATAGELQSATVQYGQGGAVTLFIPAKQQTAPLIHPGTAVGVAPAMQAGGPFAVAQSSRNAVLLASPRYLEEHPEVLRTKSSGGESPVLLTDRPARLTENIALANSPRFREAHPDLRWPSPSGRQTIAQNENDSERLSKLTQNKALAASPRYREEHPELLRNEPVFEIAPLK